MSKSPTPIELGDFVRLPAVPRFVRSGMMARVIGFTKRRKALKVRIVNNTDHKTYYYRPSEVVKIEPEELI